MEFPYIDPVIFHIAGPVALRWYALAYLVGLGAAWWFGVKRAQRPGSLWTSEEISDFVFYGFLGVVIGGRFGYVLFYHFDLFLQNPLYLFKIHEGGMSFHGGMLGVVAAFGYFAWRTKKSFWSLADFIAPLAPIGLGAGRLGNFINGELWGREVGDPDFPLGIRFTCNLEKAPWYTGCDTENLLRHPSQLYEFVLEGVVLFIILFWFSAKPRPRKAVAGLFSLGYGSFRFFVEYFREPDEHLKHMAEWLTMGQVLSAPMILLGIVLLVWAYRDPIYDHEEAEKLTKKSKQKTQKKSKAS
ncbi:prolipoprotein diacylglyceryl transferase [Pleionea litopenaei]|uniref:Phosphatidylglycerol--prolipoprotein diacylglyceryl transferase n=1 Tax=Pleionea litopenaei TaxID=3070815 RepID=A0AA51RQF9_9GAMM|nr:prolipoprotein diacylglyceryl transferase [Pleionea sp. HL-JVS1]WMS85752.1 prolipoprotein diacylglyceryl transferase [Pleionea sp. HL-JVS1]